MQLLNINQNTLYTQLFSKIKNINFSIKKILPFLNIK